MVASNLLLRLRRLPFSSAGNLAEKLSGRRQRARWYPPASSVLFFRSVGGGPPQFGERPRAPAVFGKGEPMPMRPGAR